MTSNKQGLDSRIVAVRLASLWSLLLLGIPGSGKNDDTTTAAPASAGKDHAGGGTQVRMWMLFCREAVVECKAVSALWTLWESTAATLEAGVSGTMQSVVGSDLVQSVASGSTSRDSIDHSSATAIFKFRVLQEGAFTADFVSGTCCVMATSLCLFSSPLFSSYEKSS